MKDAIFIKVNNMLFYGLSLMFLTKWTPVF